MDCGGIPDVTNWHGCSDCTTVALKLPWISRAVGIIDSTIHPAPLIQKIEPEKDLDDTHFLSLLLTFPAPLPSFLFRLWWEKSTAASECRGRWNPQSSRWSWMQLWRRGWTHTSWKSGTAGMKTLCHPHTTSNPKPKCLRTTRTRWVQLTRDHDTRSSRRLLVLK